MERRKLLSTLVVSWMLKVVFADEGLQCKNQYGQPVDWFAAMKLPKTEGEYESDGTVYLYMDSENMEWTSLNSITTEESAIGHTVSQMYAPTESYNDTLMWIVYNDEPTNKDASSTQGHSKGMVLANNNTGFWLVHSVPKFPYLPYEKDNTYEYPRSGLVNGQSFLCMSMTSEELDKVGYQLINNEVRVYGGHFGDGMKTLFPTLYRSTFRRKKINKENNGVRLQDLYSINGFKFLSVSKNRYFGKDLYEDIITNMTQTNVYTETWLNSRGRFNSSCDTQYKAINIKSLSMKSIKGLENCWFKSSKDHSKWVVTSDTTVPWTCIGDVNRALKQTKRGGGTVCIDSLLVWNQYKKLILDIENCDITPYVEMHTIN